MDGQQAGIHEACYAFLSIYQYGRCGYQMQAYLSGRVPAYTLHIMKIKGIALSGVSLVGMGLMMLFPVTSFADLMREEALSEQRARFMTVYNAKRGGSDNVKYWSQLENDFLDYPLYPYLLYRRFDHPQRRYLPELIAFLRAYPGFPENRALRSQWLESLASRGQWREYLDLYNVGDDKARSSNVRHTCLALQARMKLGEEEGLINDIIPIFLHGKSQPKKCDPLFAALYKSPLFNSELVWQRIYLAFAEGRPSLARYLGRRLDADGRKRLQQWLDMHHSPNTVLRRGRIVDDANGRRLLMHGLLRLSRFNISSAIRHWNSLSDQYAFQADEKDAALRAMGRQAVIHRHVGSLSLLDDLSVVDEEAFEWRLQSALRNQGWGYLEKWTRGTPPADVNSLQWNYWRARALEQTGDRQTAHVLFNQLSIERDYYGFMAADKMNLPYAMNHQPVADDKETLLAAYNQPTVRRAREWILLGKLSKARREWHQALQLLPEGLLQQAARLAYQWDWHRSAIAALGKAQMYDDLVIRFPLLYAESLEGQAKRHQLDSSWLFGLVRAESLFVETARSRAGALGLMQVMPATGRLVARSMGWKHFASSQLLKASYNVQIGSTYLRQMYDRFNGNVIYATAAYNAGPHRVRQWDKRLPCASTDVWIEVIPFRETKKYVKRVLMNSSVYDWRLGQQAKPIHKRLLAWQPTCQPFDSRQPS